MMQESLVRQLKRHEGFRSSPYRCSSGKLTIGYGFTYLHEDEAEMILRMRIVKLQNILRRRIRFLSPVRQNVLVNMAFNMGIAGLYSFKKMWRAIERQDFEKAANEMLNSKWERQVGDRAHQLAKAMKKG